MHSCMHAQALPGATALLQGLRQPQAYPNSSSPLLPFLSGGHLCQRVGIPSDEAEDLDTLGLHPPTNPTAVFHHICHMCQDFLCDTGACSQAWWVSTLTPR